MNSSLCSCGGQNTLMVFLGQEGSLIYLRMSGRRLFSPRRRGESRELMDGCAADSVGGEGLFSVIEAIYIDLWQRHT